jgi:hypothetical protein
VNPHGKNSVGIAKYAAALTALSEQVEGQREDVRAMTEVLESCLARDRVQRRIVVGLVRALRVARVELPATVRALMDDVGMAPLPDLEAPDDDAPDYRPRVRIAMPTADANLVGSGLTGG